MHACSMATAFRISRTPNVDEMIATFAAGLPRLFKSIGVSALYVDQSLLRFELRFEHAQKRVVIFFLVHVVSQQFVPARVTFGIVT